MEHTRVLFARHRLRCTEQRVALYEALLATRCHPTAEELHHLARSRVGRLSLATVYNTLEALCDAGLARKFPMASGSFRYDADTTDHLHVRFPATSEMEDVPADLGQRLLESVPPEVLGEIEERLGISIDGLDIRLLARRSGDGTDGTDPKLS